MGDFPDTINYDDNGNVLYDSASGAYYTYDHLNRLVKITVPNGSGGSDSIRYVYGRNGQRVEKRFYWFDGEADSAVTRYHLSGDKVLMETYPTGGTPRKSVYAGDDRIALFIGGPSNVAKYYYVKDHLGSTRLLVKSDGNVYAEYYRYRAFGELDSSWASLNQPYRYTGKPTDEEKGLNHVYYGARYLDPFRNRWLAVDPLRGKYPEWSPYVYCANNPLIYIDPNGEILIVKGNGDATNSFIQTCEQSMGGFYDVSSDSTGQVSVTATGKQGPMSSSQQAFYNTLMGAADKNVGVVSINLVKNAEDVFVDNFNLNSIDMEDVNSIGSGPYISSASFLGHAIAEQTAKQINGITNIDNAHKFGLAAESTISGATRDRVDAYVDPMRKSTTSVYGQTLDGEYRYYYTKNGNKGIISVHFIGFNITKVIR